MLGFAKSKHPMLTNPEIIFEDFEPVITIPQRHGRTERRTDDLP